MCICPAILIMADQVQGQYLEIEGHGHDNLLNQALEIGWNLKIWFENLLFDHLHLTLQIHLLNLSLLSEINVILDLFNVGEIEDVFKIIVTK